MRIISTVSSKRQITLSKDLLDNLNIAPKQKILIESGNGVAILKPLKSTIVKEIAGGLTKYVDSSKLGKSFDQILKETKKNVSRKLAKK